MMQVKPVVTGTEAAFQELAASKKILEIQQKENYKQQEYLAMVEGELDRTKSLVEIKQNELDKLRVNYEQKCLIISELQEKIKTAQMQEQVFKRLTDQNKLLLDKYQDERNKCKALDDLSKSLGEENKLLTEQLHEHTGNYLSKEVGMSVTIRDLRAELLLSKSSLETAHVTIRTLEQQLMDIRKHLIFTEERRQDEVMRSRQKCFQALQQVDNLTINFHRANDNKEYLEEVLQHSTQQGDVLQHRLATVTGEVEDMEAKLMTIYELTEASKRDMQKEMQKLVRENSSLRQRVRELEVQVEVAGPPKGKHDEHEPVSRDAHDMSVAGADSGRGAVGATPSPSKSPSPSPALKKLSIPPVSPMSPARPRTVDLSPFLGRSVSGPFPASLSGSRPAKLSKVGARASTSPLIDSKIKKSSGRPTMAAKDPVRTSSMVGVGLGGSGSDISISGEDDTSQQQQGRRVLLSRYLQLLTQARNPSSSRIRAPPPLSPSLPPVEPLRTRQASSRGGDPAAHLDLSGVGLVDEDVPLVLDCLRPLLPRTSSLSLQGNLLTESGMLSLATWIVSLPASELMRTQTLNLDLSSNRIPKTSLKDFVDCFESADRVEIDEVKIVNDMTGVLVCSIQLNKNNMTMEGDGDAGVLFSVTFERIENVQE